jgi:hypothetical protein
MPKRQATGAETGCVYLDKLSETPIHPEAESLCGARGGLADYKQHSFLKLRSCWLDCHWDMSSKTRKAEAPYALIELAGFELFLFFNCGEAAIAKEKNGRAVCYGGARNPHRAPKWHAEERSFREQLQ